MTRELITAVATSYSVVHKNNSLPTMLRDRETRRTSRRNACATWRAWRRTRETIRGS